MDSQFATHAVIFLCERRWSDGGHRPLAQASDLR
jgi:hypothetical protein